MAARCFRYACPRRRSAASATRSKKARSAGWRSRPPTARSSSMWAKSCICALNQTTSESASRPAWRVQFNAVDLALYRRVRLLAHSPDTVTWVRRYSHLGEHGAVWLATGAAAALVDRRRRRRWLRATASIGAAYATSTSIKLAVGRKRPAIEDLPH